jgi:hypothetical protein
LKRFIPTAAAAGLLEGVPTPGDNPASAQQQSAGAEQRPATTPTAENNPGTERRNAAPGQYCKAQGFSKKGGEGGSDFSKCVRALKRLNSGKADTPREACREAGMKGSKAKKGSDFSACVRAAAQMRKDQKESEQEQEQQEGEE